MAGRMAVSADYHVAGPDVAVLRQDLVADAAAVAPDVVELADCVLRHEGADELLVGGGLRPFGRHAMVEDDCDARRVPGLGLAPGILVDLLELVDHQRRILVRHGEVDARLDDIHGFDGGCAGRFRQDLFDDCHSHRNTSLAGFRLLRSS